MHADADTSDITSTLFMLANMRGNAHPEWAHPSIEHLCLEHGVVVRSLPNAWLPDLGVNRDVPEAKGCFLNSYRIAMSHPSLLYTEGYGMWHGMTIEHAWLTERETGRIVDPTWGGIKSKFGPTEIPYVGIRFSTEFVAERAMVTGMPSVIFGHHRANREIIVKGLRFDDGVAVDLRD